MKKLTYGDLINMAEHEQVRVVDKTNDYDVVCEIRWDNEYCSECGHLLNETLTLASDDYEFCYDKYGKCIDGEFKVYKI